MDLRGWRLDHYRDGECLLVTIDGDGDGARVQEPDFHDAGLVELRDLFRGNGRYGAGTGTLHPENAACRQADRLDECKFLFGLQRVHHGPQAGGRPDHVR